MSRRRAAGVGAGVGAAQRVGLIGRFGSGNIGNDATLESLLGYLQPRSARITLDCLCTDPATVRAAYGIAATQMHALSDLRPLTGRGRRARTALRIVRAGIADALRAARWVRRQDVLIAVGTGAFETTLLKRPWEGPWALACVGIAARVFRVPLVLLAVGVSPIEDRLTRTLLLTAVRSATWVAPRDAYSCEALTAMGVPTSTEAIMPDLAYLSPVPHGVEQRERKPVVGIGVIDWRESEPGHGSERRERYIATMTEFAGALTGRGYPVRLSVGDVCDAAVAEEIVRRVPGVHYRAATSPAEMVDQLTQVDIVVASRYHNALLALAMGLPTITVGYGGKHADLMREHGMGEYALSMSDVTAERLEERFLALEAERGSARGRIDTATRVIRGHLVDELARLETFTGLTELTGLAELSRPDPTPGAGTPEPSKAVSLTGGARESA